MSGCGTTAGGAVSGAGVLTIGTLYAGSGSFASSSQPEFAGLRLWVQRADAAGGVWVGALHRRQRVRLIAYNDRSSAVRASRLYARLLARDHVGIFVSDFGSVLTAPAISTAQHDGVLLFDQSGTGASFFTAGNPYIVLCDLPTSTVWPDGLARLLVARHIGRVALVYGRNYFDASQDQTIAAALTLHGDEPVINQGVTTGNSDYQGFLAAAAARHASAVVELGYTSNDIAFLRQLKASGHRFRFVFTVFAGQLPGVLRRAVGTSALAGTYSYGFPPFVQRPPPRVGLADHGLAQALYPAATRGASQTGAAGPLNFLNVAGYNTGLVIGAALRQATTATQLGLRAALTRLSGRLRTLDGTFRLNANGAQVGEIPSVARLLIGRGGELVFRQVEDGAGR
jgi:branched-chain amino acid transport system substrate-binding protein